MTSPHAHPPFASGFRRNGVREARRKRGFGGSLAVMVVGGMALAGCFTGERPSLEAAAAAQETTGSAEIDAVLERLDSVRASRFTADYSVLTKLGNRSSTATVVQASPERRSITINDVRFLYDGAQVATCNLVTAECEATINDARVSDISLTHEFYAQSFAQRLRVDADRRVADPSGYTTTQAGQQATCVDVPVSGGTKTYCALDSGALARYDGNDLFIELTSISDVPDESKFATG